MYVLGDVRSRQVTEQHFPFVIPALKPVCKDWEEKTKRREVVGGGGESVIIPALFEISKNKLSKRRKKHFWSCLLQVQRGSGKQNRLL